MLLHTYIPTYHYFLTIRAVITVPCLEGGCLSRAYLYVPSSRKAAAAGESCTG
jgi:hypothetical protein